MASVLRFDTGPSIISLGEAQVSYHGGISWGPGSNESSFQDSLGRDIIEDLLRCQDFSRVGFSWVEISECSSTRFSGTVTFLMCSTLQNVLSNTALFWGGTCPVLVFNTSSTDPVWNDQFSRQIPFLSLGYHLGIPVGPPCRGGYRMKMGKPQV